MIDSVKEFLQELYQQTPEKPDYWSSCGQCQRNANRAEDLLETLDAAAPAQSGEPVAWIGPMGMQMLMKNGEAVVFAKKIGFAEKALYAAPPAQTAQSEPFPYQKTFDAIAASTSVSAGHVAISVIKFREAFSATPQPVQTEQALTGWQPIETAPEGKLVVVAWLDKGDPDNPERHAFDFIEDGGWVRHNDDYDNFLCVAPPGSKGPSADAPYTHWMDLQDVPIAAQPASGGDHDA